MVEPIQYHFIYKTVSSSGKYYIGRHSTNNLNDKYFGSGKWVRSIKDKSKLCRYILEHCSSFEELKEKEKIYILSNIGLENCMNFNNNSIGFACGDLNPSCTLESRQKMSDRVSGDNNPSKREDVRKKKSDALKGKPSTNIGWKHTDEAKQKISEAHTGRKHSEESRKNMGDSHRGNKNLLGYIPSEETKAKISAKTKGVPKAIIKCPYCELEGGVGVMGRWHFDNCKLKKEVIL